MALTHSAALKRAGLPTMDTLVRRILKVWGVATPADIESGSSWYAEAYGHAVTMSTASGRTVEECAAVIAHLSPRQTWNRNVAGAYALVTANTIIPGLMTREVDRATSVLNDGWDDPVDSFGGPKTRRFFLNIVGDVEAVTVDVWACRVAGVDESLLSRVGVYDALERAYQLAARRVSVDPRTMQATTWIVQRGGRAN